MKQFDEQLLRLKQCLGVTKDTEVAQALGMSKAAFSNRKQSGAFPEERVVFLKRQKPELDVMYVLTGQRWEAGERVMEDTMFAAAALRTDAALASSAARMARNHVQELNDAANDPQVRELLGILVFCDRAAIEKIKTFAARVMGRTPLFFSKREAPRSHLLSAVVRNDAGQEFASVEVPVTPSPRGHTKAIHAPDLSRTLGEQSVRLSGPKARSGSVKVRPSKRPTRP